MSYAVVWEFLVSEDRTSAFEAAYAADGQWGRLFAQAPGFLEVRLLRCHDRAGRYLTIDRWESAFAFEDFKRRFAEEYWTLDQQLEGLASLEVPLGSFDELCASGANSR